MVTFYGEGGARYYDSRDARKQIHKEGLIYWTFNMFTDKWNLMHFDNVRASDTEHSYYMFVRSNYLPICNGDHFMIEPDSPHRFSHQFGYYQEIT